MINDMHIIDVPDSSRIDRTPDHTYEILTSEISQDDVLISKITLHEYRLHTDANLGIYSVITAMVYASIGTVEILYDEGYRGDDAIHESGTFLIQNLGLAGLITRSILSLKEHHQ